MTKYTLVTPATDSDADDGDPPATGGVTTVEIGDAIPIGVITEE